ncbi:MAG: prepilin-type N-terminal cleavage/methylation domain-containing protein [Lachnospirales bacterium]
MKELKKRNLGHKKGFTLVELIVVIAIIIILAALAVPRVTKYVDDAREARRKADFSTMYTSVTAGVTEWKILDGKIKEGDTAITGDGAGVDTDASKNIYKYVSTVLPSGVELVANKEAATDENQYCVTVTADAKGYITKITITDGKYTTEDGTFIE